MSGHSKWAGIKHKKAIIDSKRGKIFTKIARELTVAARAGGGNPDHNARLRKAMEQGREANMPQDNIKKAIQRGTGEIPGVTYEELVYEGYGPAGVAIIVEGSTDNKNRTASEIRKIFSSHGGNMGESGCVSWMFSQKGYITIEKPKADEEKLMSLVLDIGADDFKSESSDVFEVFTKPEDFDKVKEGIEKASIPVNSAEVTMVPQTYINLTGKDAEHMIDLIDGLESHDDVKNVFSNFDISDEEMQRIESLK